MGKGADVAKQQLDAQNKAQADAAAQQKQIRDQIMASVSKYMTGAGEGFDPAQLAQMQSAFLNQNSADFNSAGGQVLASLRSRGAGGGDQPAGGDLARSLSALDAARATSKSQGILGTNIENLKAALTNRFNAASVASGQSAQLGQDISTYGTGANNSLDQFIKAKNSPGFLQSLATSFGGKAGEALAGFASSGGSSIFNSIKGAMNKPPPMTDPSICWIAEAIYGADDIRTHAVRRYLTERGGILVSLYRKFGQRAAKIKWLVRLLRPLFDRFASRGMMLYPAADINDFESIWYQR